MKKIPDGKFYNRDSISDFNFYKMPKSLWGNSIYRGLSIGAKSMYMIMRDRQDLSIKNNWFDGKGNVYFVFDCDNLALLMEVSTSTVNRYKKELIDYELLYQRRMGQGRPNMLYILRPESVAITLNSDNDTSRKAKNATLKVSKSLPIETEVSETESARLISNHSTEFEWVCILFTECFENYFGYKHRKINKVPDLTEMEDFEIDELKECFNEYFDKYSTGIKKHDLEKCSINKVAAIFKRYTSSDEYGWK